MRVTPASSRCAVAPPLLAGALAAEPSVGSPVETTAGPRPALVPRVSESAGPVPPVPPRVRWSACPVPPADMPAALVAGPQAALGVPAALVPATVRGSCSCRLASRAAMRSSIAVRDWGAGSRAASDWRAKRSSTWVARATPVAGEDAGAAGAAAGAVRSPGSIIVISVICGSLASGDLAVTSSRIRSEWTIMLAVMLHDVRRRSFTGSMITFIGIVIAVMACPPCAAAWRSPAAWRPRCGRDREPDARSRTACWCRRAR